jgi:hypothetical protein
MGKDRQIKWILDAESGQFKKKITEAQDALDKTGAKGFSAFKLKIAAGVGAATLAIGSLVSAFGALIGAYNKNETANAKVEQAIKQTAGAAGLSAEKLKSVASELQGITVFGDEEILGNVTAQLLTFTNIVGDNFLRAQEAALDLATLLDGDLKSASIQLGKALNDPVQGLAALARSGIQFSDQQKTVIKTLAEENKLYEAQTIILDEISRQYGGQAKAVAKATGEFKKTSNAIGDLKEQLGGLLYNGFAPASAGLRTFVENLISIVAKSPVQELNDERVALNALVGAIQVAGEGTEQRARLLTELKTTYGKYLPDLNTDKVTNEELAVQMAKVNEQLLQRIKLQAAQEVYNDEFKETVELQKKQDAALIKFSELYTKVTGEQLSAAADLKKIYREFSDEAASAVGGTNTYLKEAVNIRPHIGAAAAALNDYIDTTGKLDESQSKLEKSMSRLNSLKIDIKIEENTDPVKTKTDQLTGSVYNLAESINYLQELENRGFLKGGDFDLFKDKITEAEQAAINANINVTDAYREMADNVYGDLSRLDTDHEVWMENLKDRGQQVEAFSQAMGAALVSGFETEGLKGALKQVLVTIISFLQKEVIAAQVGAGVKGILGDPTALFQMAALTALFETAKAAIMSFSSGVENYSGGLAYVHKDEMVQLPAGSNVYTKTETKRMVAGGSQDVVLTEIRDLLKAQRLSAKISGYDLKLAIDRSNKNSMKK